MRIWRIPLLEIFIVAMILSLLLVMALLPASMAFTVPLSSPGVWHVAPTGSDTEGCGSTSSPCRTIQYAVNKAASGDQILVAGGTYTYNASVDRCSFLQTRAVVCIVDKRLRIEGGYSPSNWAKPDPDANPTVIDGGNSYRGVAVIGFNTDDTYLEMEGFTIQNCRVKGPTYVGSNYDPSGRGGGMWVQKAHVTLRNLTFKDNVVLGADTSQGAGGAASGSALQIESSPQGTASLIENVLFDGNLSQGGRGPERGGVAFGALFVYKSKVTVRDSTFTNNSAIAGNSSGGGMYGNLMADALGGAMGLESSEVEIYGLVATGNQARGGNAATYSGGAYGGAIFSEAAIPLQLKDAYIYGNAAIGGDAQNGGMAAGGGVMIYNSSAYLERVQVISNAVRGGNSTDGQGSAGPPSGGGIYFWNADPDIHPCGSLVNAIVADNFAMPASSGKDRNRGGGAGVKVQGMDVDIKHTTIARNRLVSPLVLGQGLLILYSPKGGVLIPSSVTLAYSIVADHTEGGENATAVVLQENNTLTFNHVLFAGNLKDTNEDGVLATPGVFQGWDTVYYEASAGFRAPGPPDYDYHILDTSPAVDRASGSTIGTDIDQQPRPYGTAPDLGADEYWKPQLNLIPSELTVLTEDSISTTASVLIELKYGLSPGTWHASTSAPWLFLGPGGTAKEASGQTGERLILWFDPSQVSLGTYKTDVSISCDVADPVTLPVTMLKVENVWRVYLPVILRE